MEYVADTEPETVKDALSTVPVKTGNVTPPTTLLTPNGSKITDPAVDPTEILPKFIFPALAIEIGITTIADPLAVRLVWALTLQVKPDIKMIVANNIIIFFISLVHLSNAYSFWPHIQTLNIHSKLIKKWWFANINIL